MIVLDASAALAALLNEGAARRTASGEQLHAPHLIDSEVAHALRRRVASTQLTARRGRRLLDTWRQLALVRYAMHPLLDRVWDLRAYLSAYGAGYVALAEALDCPLVTADGRLARAPGTRCDISVVPG